MDSFIIIIICVLPFIIRWAIYIWEKNSEISFWKKKAIKNMDKEKEQ